MKFFDRQNAAGLAASSQGLLQEPLRHFFNGHTSGTRFGKQSRFYLWIELNPKCQSKAPLKARLNFYAPKCQKERAVESLLSQPESRLGREKEEGPPLAQ